MATVTLAIPKELKERLDKHPSIKWSEVFRNMIVMKVEELRKVEELKARGEL